MKLCFTILFLCLIGFKGMTQENTFKVIIFPAHEKNSDIYDQSDENSFSNLVSGFIKNRYNNATRLNLIWLEDLYKVAKGHEDLKIESLGNEGENREGFFLSPKMDLYIFQEKDSISGTFLDISYEFWFKGKNQYTKIIDIYVKGMNTDTIFNIKSITNNKNLQSLRDEYQFEEKKNQINFSYHFIGKFDSDLLRNGQPISMRMKHYSEQEIKTASQHQYVLLDNLKTLLKKGDLPIKSKYEMGYLDFDTSYQRNPFIYYDDAPIIQLTCVKTGEDSVIYMPDGTQLVQYSPRKQFNLEHKYLREVKVYERGTFDPQTNTSNYQPYAVSPIFIVDGKKVKDESEEFWILLSDFKKQQGKVNESTYWWFEIVKKLTGGELLFEFEPQMN